MRARLLAVLAAVLLTTGAAALARAGGVPLEVDGEPVPLSGVAFVTAVASLLGVGLSLVLRRGLRAVLLVLVAVSLVPPFLVDATTGTALTLAGLHLLAAAVVVPVLVRPVSPRSRAESRSPSRPSPSSPVPAPGPR